MGPFGQLGPSGYCDPQKNWDFEIKIRPVRFRWGSTSDGDGSSGPAAAPVRGSGGNRQRPRRAARGFPATIRDRFPDSVRNRTATAAPGVSLPLSIQGRTAQQGTEGRGRSFPGIIQAAAHSSAGHTGGHRRGGRRFLKLAVCWGLSRAFREASGPVFIWSLF